MTDTALSRLHGHEPFDLEREPLDRPPGMVRDWGGDGSDLSRPVRAHVLVALRPNSAPYPPPVDALRHLGEPRTAGVAERRHALGLAQEHLPDLVRMARDRGLYTANGDTDEVWAPLHALYALDDLDISAVVPELLPLFDLEDEWLDTSLSNLLGKVGAPALEPIRAYLADRTRWAYGHGSASNALQEIAEQHPELREQVVAILSDVLRDAEHYHESAVTGAMDSLVELGAVEALPLIRRAFELGKIDEMLRGPWGAVLDQLGIEPEDDDPLVAESQRRFEEREERFFPRAQREEVLEALERFREMNAQRSLVGETPSAPPPAPRDSRRPAQAKARKHKNKRKIESASRKANRRKRK
jgi:hypothetical protein